MFNRNKSRLLTLPLGVVHPSSYQPRRTFDEDELQNLSNSIRKNGLLQPISVRKCENGGYELIAGERRLRAARMAGLTEIPCIEINVDDRRAAHLALVENMQREDLNIFEEAEAIRRLMSEWGVSQLEVAQRLGKAQSTIANKLRLLALTPSQRSRILAAKLSERHARALLRLNDEKQRDDTLNIIIAHELTVHETEEYIDGLLEEKRSQQSNRPSSMRTSCIGDVRIYINTLTRAVESIRKSGLDAKSSEKETDSFIEYTVYLPKLNAK